MKRPLMLAAALAGALGWTACSDGPASRSAGPTATSVRTCEENTDLCRYGLAPVDARRSCAGEPHGCDPQPKASGPVHDARDCDWRIRFRGIAAGVGVRFASFRVDNRSGHTCRLAGVPTVRLLDDQGQVVAARQSTDTSVDVEPKPLPDGVVAAGGWAGFLITIANDPSRRGDIRDALQIRLPHTAVRHHVRMAVPGDDRTFDPAPGAGFGVTRIGSTT